MIKRRNWFKAYVVDVLPCISIAFYILAYVYHSTFYSVFGIDIIRYTTFGDLFLSITEPLVIYALFAAFLICIIYELYKNTLPSLIRQAEEKRKRPLSFNKFNYWYLRVLVNIRNSKFVRYIKEKRARRRNNTRRRTNLLFSIIVFYSFFLICLTILADLITAGKIEPTLLSSAIALIIPIACILIGSFIYILYFPRRVAQVLQNIKHNTLYIIVFLVLYYLYAIVVFSSMGYADAERIKEKNLIKFEIRTTSGEIYTDKDYGYIDKMYDYTYLFDKKTKENIILGKNAIEYIKIIDKRPTRFTYLEVWGQKSASFSKKVESVFK